MERFSGDQVMSGMTLLTAARLGVHQEVALRLRLGTDPNLTDTEGDTALIHAARGGHVTCVRTLLRACAAVNHQNQSGHTALTISARHGSVAVIRALIQHGAQLEACDHQREQTALIWAMDGDLPKSSKSS